MAKIIHFPTPDSDLLLLHIELKEITPKIWRRFAVPANITLVKLHRVIQDVMGWSDSHLHEFEIAGERYGTPDPDGWGRQVTPKARKTLTKVLDGKRAFTYVYDLGDSWEHDIKVEKTLPANACPQIPYCFEGANACPPEDIGGEGGYEVLREAIADPEHPEHDVMMEWIGEDFDPTRFDQTTVNHWLARIKV